MLREREYECACMCVRVPVHGAPVWCAFQWRQRDRETEMNSLETLLDIEVTSKVLWANLAPFYSLTVNLGGSAVVKTS